MILSTWKINSLLWERCSSAAFCLSRAKRSPPNTLQPLPGSSQPSPALCCTGTRTPSSCAGPGGFPQNRMDAQFHGSCVPFQQHLPWALHRFGCSAPAKKWCCSLLQLLAKTQPSPSRHCLPLESQTLCAEPPTGAQLLHAHQPKKIQPCRGASAPAPASNPRGNEFPTALGSDRCCPGAPGARCPEAVPAVLRAGWHTQPGSCEILGYSPRPQMEIGGCTILQPRTDPFLPGAEDATPSSLLLSLLGDRAFLERGHRAGWRLGVIFGGLAVLGA